MLQAKLYTAILSRVGVLLLMSSMPLGRCNSVPHKQGEAIKKQGIKTSQITLNFLEKQKQIGVFAIGNRHHIWRQFIVAWYKPFYQIGTGYRYLLKNSNPSQSSFLGIYAYFGPYNYTKYPEKIAWTIGFETANSKWQSTLNFYGHCGLKKSSQLTSQCQEEIFGLSNRLSWYCMQHMKSIGRFNPFVFLAYTDVRNVQIGAEKKPC